MKHLNIQQKVNLFQSQQASVTAAGKAGEGVQQDGSGANGTQGVPKIEKPQSALDIDYKSDLGHLTKEQIQTIHYLVAEFGGQRSESQVWNVLKGCDFNRQIGIELIKASIVRFEEASKEQDGWVLVPSKKQVLREKSLKRSQSTKPTERRAGTGLQGTEEDGQSGRNGTSYQQSFQVRGKPYSQKDHFQPSRRRHQSSHRQEFAQNGDFDRGSNSSGERRRDAASRKRNRDEQFTQYRKQPTTANEQYSRYSNNFKNNNYESVRSHRKENFERAPPRKVPQRYEPHAQQQHHTNNHRQGRAQYVYVKVQDTTTTTDKGAPQAESSIQQQNQTVEANGSPGGNNVNGTQREVVQQQPVRVREERGPQHPVVREERALRREEKATTNSTATVSQAAATPPHTRVTDDFQARNEDKRTSRDTADNGRRPVYTAITAAPVQAQQPIASVPVSVSNQERTERRQRRERGEIRAPEHQFKRRSERDTQSGTYTNNRNGNTFHNREQRREGGGGGGPFRETGGSRNVEIIYIKKEQPAQQQTPDQGRTRPLQVKTAATTAQQQRGVSASSGKSPKSDSPLQSSEPYTQNSRGQHLERNEDFEGPGSIGSQKKKPSPQQAAADRIEVVQQQQQQPSSSQSLPLQAGVQQQPQITAPVVQGTQSVPNLLSTQIPVQQTLGSNSLPTQQQQQQYQQTIATQPYNASATAVPPFATSFVQQTPGVMPFGGANLPFTDPSQLLSQQQQFAYVMIPMPGGQQVPAYVPISFLQQQQHYMPFGAPGGAAAGTATAPFIQQPQVSQVSQIEAQQLRALQAQQQPQGQNAQDLQQQQVNHSYNSKK